MATNQKLKKVKFELAKLADFRCEYCKSPERFAPQTFSLDHILPVSKGGSDEFDNLAFACQGCNGSKLNRTHGYDPVTNYIVPLFNPRLQNWDEHFTWDKTFIEVIGLSDHGRATIEMLKLNRKQLLILRSSLIEFGEHPPGMVLFN